LFNAILENGIYCSPLLVTSTIATKLVRMDARILC